MSEIKRIASIARANSSVNGNPSFWIRFTDGMESRTMSDTACVYAVGNPDMREGCLVSVTFTRSGRIRTMGPVTA